MDDIKQTMLDWQAAEIKRLKRIAQKVEDGIIDEEVAAERNRVIDCFKDLGLIDESGNWTERGEIVATAVTHLQDKRR